MQIVSGLEMSIANQYFDDSLISIKQRDLEQKSKIKSKPTHEWIFNYKRR